MRNNEAGSVTVKWNSLPFGDIYIIDFGVLESCHQFGYTFTSQKLLLAALKRQQKYLTLL